jgi:four helix bundle protein
MKGEKTNYEQWLDAIPAELTQDTLWRVKSYRLALFAADLGWDDIAILCKDRRTKGLSDQLYRSLGSISANVAEGYSRGTGRDRARFYEYALGSTRESRDWYYKFRHVLGDEVLEHRLQLLTEISKLLLSMIPNQRGETLREASLHYQFSAEE